MFYSYQDYTISDDAIVASVPDYTPPKYAVEYLYVWRGASENVERIDQYEFMPSTGWAYVSWSTY